MTTPRERIGSAIAYDVDWHAMGYSEVMRAGGSIILTERTRSGKVMKQFKITVEECSE